MSDTLLRLVKPFDPRYIEHLQKGKDSADYVTHSVVEQRLLSVLGVPPDIRVVRELYDGETLTGCVLRMELTIDETDVTVEEAGEADNPQSKTNGARLKDAISDAYKRCAMRLGVGLHLWAQDSFFLYESMRARADAVQTIQAAQGVGAEKRGDVATPAALAGPRPPLGASVPATTSGEAETSTASQVSGDDPSPPDATVDEAAAPGFGEGSVAAAASPLRAPLHTFVGEETAGPCRACGMYLEAPEHVVPTRARP